MGEFFSNVIHSQLWQEQAEPDNPFAAAACYCRGYDVYGQMLGKAGYFEYLFLLFQGERPSRAAARALEILALALANPGPRDPSVHAAMAGGVAGSPASALLTAALAVGAGSYGGAREVFLAMQNWQACGQDGARWHACLSSPPPPTPPLIWPTIEHAPGFDPHGASCTTPVRQVLQQLLLVLPNGPLAWLASQREALELAAGRPLAMTGLAACALFELGFSPAQGEMLTLLLRLPGAAVHALEQAQAGFKQFPFFEMDLQNDPGPRKEAA